MMAYTNTERKRAYERVYQRERRAMLAAHRLCYACKQQDAGGLCLLRGLPGKIREKKEEV